MVQIAILHYVLTPRPCKLKISVTKLLLAGNLAVILLLTFSYAALFVAPDKFWVLSLAGLAYPWIVSINLLFAMVWLLVKPRWSLISIFLILAGWPVLARFIQTDGQKTDKIGVKVLSYNVKYFTGEEDIPPRETANRIISFLEESSPDIICLQEVTLRTNQIFNLEAVRNQLPGIQHYQYARTDRTTGSVTFSRYPIVNMEEIRFENSGNIAICTDVKISGDTVRVFNVHLQSYRLKPENYRLLESPVITSEKDLREAKELGSRYRWAVRKRAEQSRLLRSHIESSPYPVIVCGDFNDTPSSYAYQTTKGTLKDAFRESGKGIGQTYTGSLVPSFRIDYILHSSSFSSFNFKVYPVDFSDHRPVSTLLIRN